MAFRHALPAVVSLLLAPICQADWRFNVVVKDKAGRPVGNAKVRMYMIKSDLAVAETQTDRRGSCQVSVDISRPPLDCSPLRVFLSAEKSGYLGTAARMEGRPRATYTLRLHKTHEGKDWLALLGELALDVADAGLLLVPYSAPIKPLFTGKPEDAAPPGMEIRTVEGVKAPTLVIGGKVVFGDRNWKKKVPPGAL